MTSTIAKMFVAFVATAMLVTGFTAGAFARDKDTRHHRLRHHVITEGANTDSQTVMSGGQYVGRDPDARARAQMLIDYNRGVSSMGGR
jgi:hypothetical protein